PALAALAPPVRLAGQSRVHLGSRPGLDPRYGSQRARADDRISGRSAYPGADRPQLPDRRRARSRLHPGRLLLPEALSPRQRLSEILLILPGSSLVVAPTDRDLAASEMSAGLEESFGGGGYTALQRAALLQLAWDHVSSALDGRESAFEMHASGGMPNWRGW